MFIIMAYSWLSLALAQMVHQFNHTKQLLFKHFAKKTSLRLSLLMAYSWQSLVSGPHPDGPGFLDKIEINPSKHPKELLFQQLCPKINPWWCPGSGPSGTCRRSLWGLGFTQMVLAVRKTLKTTHLNIPNSFCFNNFAQKSIPGDVRAQVLQEPVGASHGDQGRKSKMPPMFWDPGGQEESNGTPHLALASKATISRVGVVVPIYNKIHYWSHACNR